MVQSRSGFGFLYKTAPTVLIGQLFSRQNLQRDKPIQANIAGFLHSPHATFAQLRFNAVMSERLTDHGSAHVLAVYLRPHPNSTSTDTPQDECNDFSPLRQNQWGAGKINNPTMST